MEDTYSNDEEVWTEEDDRLEDEMQAMYDEAAYWEDK